MMNWYKYNESWKCILYIYLPRLFFCSLIWEISQLPLYTLWATDDIGSILFSVVHCTIGDAMIGFAALSISLTILQANQPSHWPVVKIGWLMVAIAMSYTLFSEIHNVRLGHWAYSTWMPVLPWIEVGISPLLQWLVVPHFAWRWASLLFPTTNLQ